MAHIKYVSPAGWDWDRPIAVPMKWSSRGLCGADRQEFIKTAGHAFEPVLDTLKVAKDEVPIHLIGLGAQEAWGFNRNGDGFSERDCELCHPTFVKFAKWFRNHKNKPAQGHPHFGIIKASAYNKAMRRVELIACLNAEKSACERNGGFVADKELEKLARGDDLPVSMACRVPHDVCSYCGNKARTRDEYCTREKCAAGGCKDNLTRVIKLANDIHHLGVYNPGPTWFDMSLVFRPADRTAYGAKADWLTKAAADHGVLDLQDAIKMAADDTAPLEVVLYQDGLPGEWGLRTAAQIKLAYALASLERQERANPTVGLAFDARLQSGLDVARLGEPGTIKAAEGLGALADRKIVMSLRDFAAWTKQAEHTAAAARCLPGVYQRMVDDGSLDRRVEQNRFPLSEKLASASQRALAGLATAEHSLSREAVQSRCSLASVRGWTMPEKCAAEVTVSPDAEQLARDYAIYKVAALQRIAATDSEFHLTCRLALQQNLRS